VVARSLGWAVFCGCAAVCSGLQLVLPLPQPNPSTHPSTHPPIHPPTHPPTHPSIQHALPHGVPQAAQGYDERRAVDGHARVPGRHRRHAGRGVHGQGLRGGHPGYHLLDRPVPGDGLVSAVRWLRLWFLCDASMWGGLCGVRLALCDACRAGWGLCVGPDCVPNLHACPCCSSSRARRYCATYIPGGQEFLFRCFGIKT